MCVWRPWNRSENQYGAIADHIMFFPGIVPLGSASPAMPAETGNQDEGGHPLYGERCFLPVLRFCLVLILYIGAGKYVGRHLNNEVPLSPTTYGTQFLRGFAPGASTRFSFIVSLAVSVFLTIGMGKTARPSPYSWIILEFRHSRRSITYSLYSLTWPPVHTRRCMLANAAVWIN